MIKKYCDRCKTQTETGSSFQEKKHTSKNYWGMGINFHLCYKCSKIFHQVLKRFYEVILPPNGGLDIPPIKPKTTILKKQKVMKDSQEFVFE